MCACVPHLRGACSCATEPRPAEPEPEPETPGRVSPLRRHPDRPERPLDAIGSLTTKSPVGNHQQKPRESDHTPCPVSRGTAETAAAERRRSKFPLIKTEHGSQWRSLSQHRTERQERLDEGPQDETKGDDRCDVGLVFLCPTTILSAAAGLLYTSTAVAPMANVTHRACLGTEANRRDAVGHSPACQRAGQDHGVTG